MKKAMYVFLAALLCLTLLSACGAPAASPEPDQVTAYVTVSSAGELTLARGEVAVTDEDGDGAVSLDEVLTAAHRAYCPDGEDGYASYTGDYGRAVSRLWGVENGGSYGYYINNVGAMNVDEPVADGDYVAAYSYADLAGWSDAYAYFDCGVADAAPGEAVALTLSYVGWDADYNPVTLPVMGASILVDGEATSYVTAQDGSVQVSFAEAGTYVVSAVSDDMTLVPPVCVVTVE